MDSYFSNRPANPEKDVGSCDGKTFLPPGTPVWVIATLFGIGYFLCAWASRYLHAPGGPFIPIWLASGLYVAGLLLNERRIWPWLILAVFPANVYFDLIMQGTKFIYILVFYSVNTFQALLGAWLIQRFVSERPTLSTIKELIGLLGFSAVLSTILGATISATLLTALGSSTSYADIWKNWVAGEAMAILLFSSFILTWFSKPFGSYLHFLTQPKILVEAILLVLVSLALTWHFLSMEEGALSPNKSPLIVPLLWAGLRFGPRGATAANLLMVLPLAFFTTHFVSPEEASSNADLFDLHFTLTIASLVGLIPAIVLQSLNESEERFRNLTAAAFEGIFISENGRIIDANDQGLKMFGYERREMIGLEIRQLVSPETLSIVLEAIRTGRETAYEHQLIRKDGSAFYAEAQAKMARVGDRVLRMTALRDITERRSVEKVLSESEMRFRTLLDESPVAINVSRNGIGLYANLEFLQLFGLKSPRESIGREVYTYFAQAFQDESRERIRRRKNGLPTPREYESVGLRSDGVTFPMRVEVGRVKLADGMAEIGFITDITERKHAEQQILEQAALLDQARDAIIVRDFDGRILFWNKGAERMYGWTRHDAIGQSIAQLIYPDAEKFEAINRLILSQGEWSGELQLLAKDRKELTVEARLTLVRNDAGEPKSVLAIQTDVTEKKRIEAQFMRAQRMESIGTLASGIAHDLNNILTPIMMSIDILKLTATDAQAKRILNSIDVSSKRGASIVKQVLSFARGMEGERVEIEPRQLLKELDIIIKNTFPKNIGLEISLCNEPWRVLGDPTQLQQILLNLCVNARDAMPDGGTLIVKVEKAAIDKPSSAMHLQAKPGNYVVIDVADSGSGIPSSILDKIFDPFFTTKEVGKGTGLGLSTVLAIVKSHDGFVNVISEIGRGTTFKIHLPAMDAPREARVEVVEGALPRGKGETVLIVDDEASVLAVTSQTLEAFGYRTYTANNGVEAEAIYTKYAAEISAVLTDMAMPIMDGPATIRALKKINPAAKIIVASGSETGGSGAKQADAGIKHILSKPYTAGTLLKTLRKTLDEG